MAYLNAHLLLGGVAVTAPNNLWLARSQSVDRKASADVMLHLGLVSGYALAMHKVVNVMHTKTMLSRIGADLLGSQKTSIENQRVRNGYTGGWHLTGIDPQEEG